jgi:hypothetical protein
VFGDGLLLRGEPLEHGLAVDPTRPEALGAGLRLGRRTLPAGPRRPVGAVGTVGPCAGCTAARVGTGAPATVVTGTVTARPVATRPVAARPARTAAAVAPVPVTAVTIAPIATVAPTALADEGAGDQLFGLAPAEERQALRLTAGALRCGDLQHAHAVEIGLDLGPHHVADLGTAVEQPAFKYTFGLLCTGSPPGPGAVVTGTGEFNIDPAGHGEPSYSLRAQAPTAMRIDRASRRSARRPRGMTRLVEGLPGVRPTEECP